MYTFTFDFTEQDYIDYNIFHTYHRSNIWLEKIVQLGLPLLPFLASILGKTSWDAVTIGINCIISLTLYMLITRKKAYNNLIAQRARNYIKGKGSDQLFGFRTIVFDEDYILEHTEYEDIKTKYTKLTDVIEAKQGVYLYTCPIIAIVLPNRVFASTEEKAQFAAFIRTKLI